MKMKMMLGWPLASRLPIEQEKRSRAKRLFIVRCTEVNDRESLERLTVLLGESKQSPVARLAIPVHSAPRPTP
jgi:hypothetical protein